MPEPCARAFGHDWRCVHQPQYQVRPSHKALFLEEGGLRAVKALANMSDNVVSHLVPHMPLAHAP